MATYILLCTKSSKVDLINVILYYKIFKFLMFEIFQLDVGLDSRPGSTLSIKNSLVPRPVTAFNGSSSTTSPATTTIISPQVPTTNSNQNTFNNNSHQTTNESNTINANLVENNKINELNNNNSISKINGSTSHNTVNNNNNKPPNIQVNDVNKENIPQTTMNTTTANQTNSITTTNNTTNRFQKPAAPVIAPLTVETLNTTPLNDSNQTGQTLANSNTTNPSLNNIQQTNNKSPITGAILDPQDIQLNTIDNLTISTANQNGTNTTTPAQIGTSVTSSASSSSSSTTVANSNTSVQNGTIELAKDLAQPAQSTTPPAITTTLVQTGLSSIPQPIQQTNRFITSLLSTTSTNTKPHQRGVTTTGASTGANTVKLKKSDTGRGAIDFPKSASTDKSRIESFLNRNIPNSSIQDSTHDPLRATHSYRTKADIMQNNLQSSQQHNTAAQSAAASANVGAASMLTSLTASNTAVKSLSAAPIKPADNSSLSSNSGLPKSELRPRFVYYLVIK